MPRLEIIDIPFYAKYHWKQDKPDSRDYKYTTSNKNQKNVIDLRQYCTDIEDQGSLGSCTGQAIASAIELHNKRLNITDDISRLFIYYYERAMIGTTNFDSGAYIRDGIKVCNKQGAPLEKLWPYNIKKFKEEPNKLAIADASKRKVSRYERVDNHQGCLDALTNGYPVTIGFKVYSSFESPVVYNKGIMPFPNVRKEKLLGGHAVLLVGYDKNRECYIVRNSWGKNWGDSGYFYMPFQVIDTPSMSSDFWIIKSVNIPNSL